MHERPSTPLRPFQGVWLGIGLGLLFWLLLGFILLVLAHAYVAA